MNNKYAIQMKNITKIFNETLIANDDINLDVEKGEIHALVGENGAGKSTLMSILFGLYQPTSGEIIINGKPTIITNPIKANELGIGMVHQHFKLVEVSTVWENIALGQEDMIGKIFINKNKIKTKITEIMNEYNLFVDLDAKIQNISVGMQQRVEIIKILYRKAEIIVFDEPTAVLTPDQISALLDIMVNLKKMGKTIIFITHKMDEIKKVADKATIIRHGKYIKTLDVKTSAPEEIAEAMVGRKIVEAKNTYKPVQSNEPILSVINLTVKKESNNKIVGLEGFSVDVRPGEIVAIAGVEGNGQKELIDVITGLTKPVTGGVVYKGINILRENITTRYKMGMSHIPEDRHKHGMILDFSVKDNVILQEISNKPFSKFGFVKDAEISKYTQQIITEFDVRGAREGKAVARGLSGGNQQKVVVGREMRRDHDLLIVVQPTRGLDVGAIEYIHGELLKEKEEGKAILLVSYELNEVMALADRIVVVNDGKKIGEVKGKGAKKEVIGALMAGNKTKEVKDAI
ncbi:ABC transporter ATP-binding protein [[Acholeplasma] multilocale]|uniref:ABC transporter ATP-binding protein n=1 Tax=[Acholeplasma] multilocale TaxID=264638 RepID=UPI00047A0D4D|nr:ABC transporter ATP-binding protein [[Acholeplasma] multilocale]